MTYFKIFTIVLIALSSALAAPAMAAPKWEVIVLNDQGMFYIDANSVTQEAGRKVLWSAIDYKKTQTTAQGQPYLSAQTQLMVNCEAKMARVMHLTHYSGAMLTGKVVSRQGMLHDWMDIDPTSAIQRIARRVC
ncbi:surface-adhesin E family protein [Limnohabitans sp. 2KL-51]|uniref:surface-adhesin E family protein n=1 Tax=Limnohabitans sp. 2KL-51 TaxID=1977911 RepID=UPI0011B22306|nr:surface-adhesin E family protein [Limnohabitans sp. 2KL-51]